MSVAFGRTDTPFRPRRLENGDEGHQGYGVGREPKLLQLGEQRWIGQPHLGADILPLLVGGFRLAKALDELHVPFPKIVLFVAPSAIGKRIVCHCASMRIVSV